ncbi:DUF4232 domain-containing protein [Asanoa sp. NPDC049573]|uniref:DUF4232 domain-containing protein n=1 Tax=Asanoa sp. NPDC049573 TaxID=3155396 RepID=UPI003445333E
MRSRWICLLVGVVTAAALTACTEPPPPAPPGGTPTTPGPAAPAPATTVTAPATAAPPPSRGGGVCAAGDLTLTAAGAEGAAGTSYTTYRLTNDAAGACTLEGYPGVSYLDAAGHEVQRDAAREPGLPTPRVRLAHGAAALFTVANSTVEQCPGPRDAVTLRVYPPDNTAALSLAGSYRVCDPRVRPVAPAS